MVSGITSGSRKKVGVPASSEEDCNSGIQAVVLELTRWGGGRQAIRLKRTWWRWDTSSCVQIDTAGGRDERLGSEGRG